METIIGKNQKLVEKIICCPICRGVLRSENNQYLCLDYSHGPFRRNEKGQIFLMTGASGLEFEKSHNAGVNRLKSLFKKYPRIYYLLWYIFCPVLLSGRRPGSIDGMVSKDGIILNIGSGPRRIRERFINVDVVMFPEVDIVADAKNLPFRDSSVDAIVSESLFEHVDDPEAVSREMARVLKRGGLLYASVPFLTPYHASPDDFQRWTKSGLRKLLDFCEVREEGVDGGPFSALLIFLAYWLGTIFSFGSRRASPVLGLFFMILLGPLKIFDFIFSRLPGADAVAAQLYFMGRKK